MARAELEGLRAQLEGNPRFEALVDRARESSLEAHGHQELPFEKLVEELQPDRDLEHTPLFQVMFILQNVPMEALDLPEVRLEPVPVRYLRDQFPALEFGEGRCAHGS